LKQSGPNPDDIADFVVIEDSPTQAAVPTMTTTAPNNSNIPTSTSSPKITPTPSSPINNATLKSSNPLATSAEIKSQQASVPLPSVQGEGGNQGSFGPHVRRERSQSTNPFDAENLPTHMVKTGQLQQRQQQQPPQQPQPHANATQSHNPFDNILAQKQLQQQQANNNNGDVNSPSRATTAESNNNNIDNNSATAKATGGGVGGDAIQADSLSPAPSPMPSPAKGSQNTSGATTSSHVKMLSPKIRYPGFQVTMHICWPAPIVGMFLYARLRWLYLLFYIFVLVLVVVVVVIVVVVVVFCCCCWWWWRLFFVSFGCFRSSYL
jgi:hypothetical protein